MSMAGRIEVHQHVNGEDVIVWSRDNMSMYEANKVNSATNLLHYNASPANIKIVLDVLVPEKTDDGT